MAVWIVKTEARRILTQSRKGAKKNCWTTGAAGENVSRVFLAALRLGGFA
jgi:hypothetical protein